MLRIALRSNREPILYTSACHSNLSLLRVPRRVLALLILGIYLLAGVLHGVCDFDVTSSPGRTVISLSDTSRGTSEHGIISHHCHGCFSVSMPAPVLVARTIEPAREVIVAHVVLRRGLSPGIDLPPPKILI